MIPDPKSVISDPGSLIPVLIAYNYIESFSNEMETVRLRYRGYDTKMIRMFS